MKIFFGSKPNIYFSEEIRKINIIYFASSLIGSKNMTPFYPGKWSYGSLFYLIAPFDVHHLILIAKIINEYWSQIIFKLFVFSYQYS